MTAPDSANAPRAGRSWGEPPAPTEITIKIDRYALGGVEAEYLALYWYVAQANPAPFGDKEAGELVERIGREIIRRWLKANEPPLWHHQGRDHTSHELGRFAHFDTATQQWVPGAARPDVSDQSGEAHS